VEFYGEERQQTDAGAFYTSILKFVRAYKAAEVEVEQKKRATLRNQSPPETINKLVGKKQQEALINELKKRQVSDNNNKKVQEAYHGALEDILSDLKSEPYRRADALRRSQRKQINNQRLSKNYDDFDDI